MVNYVASDSIGTAAAIASLIGLNMSFQVAAPAMCLYRYGRMHADVSLYLALYTYTGIFTDNRAHLPQIFIVVFRTKQLGLAVALPEVYPCTRPFLRARVPAEEAVRACGLAGPHSAHYKRPVPSGPSFCCVCLFVCSLVRLFLCLGVCVFPMVYAFARRR